MEHDLVAELRAYRVELHNHELYDRTERAKQVRAQLGGVITAVKDKIKQLTEQAELQDAQGGDVAAAEARVEARRYQAALDEDAPEPGSQNTADNAPRERAVPGRRKS